MKRFDITDMEGIEKEFYNMFRNKMAFFDGDPKQGGKRITLHEHLEAMGIKYIPTGDYERMKIVREESYRNELHELIERRKWNAGIETSESDIKEFRRIWLIGELERIKGWEESNPQDRPENLLELKRYANYINNELSILEIPQQWKSLPNLREYLLCLNRLLSKLPNKLSTLFPRANINNQWNDSARLLPNEYLAATQRYGQLDFINDADVLSNIRLDPDFAFFLNEEHIEFQQVEQQVDKIQSVLDYLQKCQTYTSDFDINTVEANKTVFWNIIVGLDEITNWLYDLFRQLNSRLPTPRVAPFQSEFLQHDNKESYSIPLTANYRETNIWLKNRLHLALFHADDKVDKVWMHDFLSEIKTDFTRSEIIFRKHLDHYLENRKKYIQHNNLYSEFFEEQGGFSEDMLQSLTNRVQTMYLNGKHALMPEILVGRIYANNFMINRLNKWREENSQPTVSVPLADHRPNNFNRPMHLAEVRKWFIQLAENNSKNGKPFLTIEQVGQFIERAFVGNVTIQKLTLNMAEGERTSITKLFYLFYQRCTNDYAIEPTKHCKEKYVRLLTDNFTNYNYNTVFGTFNNSRNAPKQWNTTV